MSQRFKKLPLGSVPVTQNKKSYSWPLEVKVLERKKDFIKFKLSIVCLLLFGVYFWFKDINHINIPKVQEVQAESIYKANSIKEILWLEDCRTTQTEEDHIKKWRGSVYAMDIACKKWFKFDVKAPKYFEFYRIKAIKYDEKLGNYIILKHWEYEFVFWHTESARQQKAKDEKIVMWEVWDRVEAWEVIWWTDQSWMSQNEHLHFEVWKDWYNISYKHLLNQEVSYNMEHTYKLRKQRGWYLAEREAMDFIADFEGFRATPYEDGWRYSIWYWTLARSMKDKVTKEEAKRRKMEEVERVMESIYKNHFVKTHNQRIALASALYNKWINSKIANVKNRKTEEWVKSWFLQDWVVKKWSKYEKWLTKRYELTAKKYLEK